jgi:protein gp37
MGETTIEWAGTPLPDGRVLPGFTFNAWIGCEKVSPGCKNCYAEVDTYARVSKSRGLPLWGPGSSRHVTSDAYWRKPLSWNRQAGRDGVRRRVFCSSLSDIFEERLNPKPGYHYDDVTRRARANLWRLIFETPHLDWLLLTKRPENADRLALQAWSDEFALATHDNVPETWWLPNIWLGTTCEDQERADERVPRLLETPAAVRFVSYEPALGPVNFADIQVGNETLKPLAGLTWYPTPTHFATQGVTARKSAKLDWIIVGSESGSHARPMSLAWVRAVIDQCRAAGTAVFVKQIATDADPKGGDTKHWPAGEWPREWPKGGC